MNKSKAKKLKSAGWQVGDTGEFLSLSEAESMLIEIRRALTELLRDARTKNQITQIQLAELISSSQSRVAKMEAFSADVSLELMLRALFALGVTHKRVGKVISQVGS